MLQAVCILMLAVFISGPVSSAGQNNPPQQKKNPDTSSNAGHEEGPQLIDLFAAVRKTMENQSSIQIQREQVNIAKGANQAAGGDFDWKMETYMTQRQDNSPVSAMDYTTAVKTLDTTETGVRFAKLFSQGIYIEPGLKYTGYDYSLPSNQHADPLKTGSVSLVLRVPLLQGLGHENTGYREISSLFELDAARLNLKHDITTSVHNAVQAFWGYLAAHDQLAVYSEAEERARMIVEKTDALVKANEAPAAEIINVKANLADKETARISAEQTYVSARARLGTTMGIPASEIDNIPPPRGSFPKLDRKILANVLAGDSAKYNEIALINRNDLEAIRKQNESLTAQLKAARNRLKPQLNLEFSVGYDGVRNSSGTSQSLQTIEYHQDEPDWTTGFRISCPLENNTAKGELEQVQAKCRQGSIQENELMRNIRTQISVTRSDLLNICNEIQKSEEAVSNYTKAISNEREKYLMGETTILGLLYIEDRRDVAFVNNISVRQKAALAIARLRYETGRLVRFSNDEVIVEPEDLISLALPDHW